MSKLDVIAGDLELGKYTLGTYPSIYIKKHYAVSFSIREQKPLSIDKENINYISIMDEEKINKLSSMMGWGFLGGIALGPIGAIGGLLFSSKKQVTFACELKNGKKFLATCPSSVWKKIQIAHF